MRLAGDNPEIIKLLQGFAGQEKVLEILPLKDNWRNVW